MTDDPPPENTLNYGEQAKHEGNQELRNDSAQTRRLSDFLIL